MSFSFSFAGDDIEDDNSAGPHVPSPPTASNPPAANAFPVQGKPLLPPIQHDLNHMLAALPSKIAYSLLDVDLDGSASVQIPRRELWDVRVQLMAEDDRVGGGEEVEPGLGSHDVKTGIYEGGFKSWESSVDMVKVLAAEDFPASLIESPIQIIEVSGQDPRLCPPRHLAHLIHVVNSSNRILLTRLSPRKVGLWNRVAFPCALPMGPLEQGTSPGGVEGAAPVVPHPGRL